MARLDSAPVPAEDAGARRKRRSGIVGVVGLLAVLVLAVSLVWARDFRASQMARQAEELAAGGRIPEAWERVRAARQVAPGDLAILRAAARIAEQAAPREAAKLWETARSLSGDEVEDLRGQVRAALALREWESADRFLAELRTVEGDSIGYLSWRTHWHAGQGDMIAAHRVASRLLARDDLEDEQHWLYVRAALGSPRQADNVRARTHLRDLALSRRDMPRARSALRWFSELDSLSESERDFSIRRWADLAENREERLLALQLRLAQTGARRETIAAEAIRLFELSDPAERLLLGRWLNRNELYEASLEVVPEALAMTRRDLFLVRLDAFALLDRWDAVQALLSQNRAPLQPYLEELFRMRSHYQTGDMPRARVAWERSLQAARRDPDQLQFLARYTTTLGLFDLTIEVLWQAVEQVGLKRAAYEGLLGIHESRKETAGVLGVLARMREDYPHDHAVLNDWAYYSLLMRIDQKEAVSLTERLIELNPELLSHRMTRVLGYLREEGSPTLALALVESLPVEDWTQVESARWRALLAVVLAQNGRRAEARLALRDVDGDRLMPEELDLLKQLAW